MLSDHERIKNIAAAMQSVVVALALVVGGIWTLITFSALGESRKAHLEVAELEGKLRRQAAVEIRVDASQDSLPGDPGRYIFSVVSIVNSGSRAVNLSFPPDGPFSVHQLQIDQDGSKRPTFAVYDQVQSYRKTSVVPMLGVVVRPGAVYSVPFVTRVPEAGLYVVSFYSETPPAEADVAIEAGVPPGDPLEWEGKRLLIVR